MTTAEEPTRRRYRTSDRLARGSALVGAVALGCATAAIWGARLWLDQDVYVSQLGADGAPTAGLFNTALLLLALGGASAGLSLRGQRATAAVLSRWTLTTTLVTAGLAFAVASQVTCTAGCPVPLTPAAQVQDLVHVVAAVIGFAAAAWAMLQVGWSPAPRAVRDASRAAAVAVGAAAATGGLLSIAQLGTDVGAGLEFLAMTIATSWLVALAAWASHRAPRSSGRCSAQHQRRRLARSRAFPQGRSATAPPTRRPRAQASTSCLRAQPRRCALEPSCHRPPGWLSQRPRTTAGPALARRTTAPDEMGIGRLPTCARGHAGARTTEGVAS